MFKKIIKYFKTNERYIYLEYGVFTLLIIWPLLKFGQIFALDMAWPVKHIFPQQVFNYYLYDIGNWFLDIVFPAWLSQKIIIFLVVFLSANSFIVCALSCADIPVVTPFFASTETVKAVLK